VNVVGDIAFIIGGEKILLLRFLSTEFWTLLNFVYRDDFFCGEGAPQLLLRTHRSLKAYCATRVMKMKMKLRMRLSSLLPSFTSNGAPVEWNWQGKTDNSEKKINQCHFVHHKSHMDLTWDRTRASVVRDIERCVKTKFWKIIQAWLSSELHAHIKLYFLPHTEDSPPPLQWSKC
jgi:hypothetical protein